MKRSLAIAEDTRRRAVVLLSGGLDSAVALAKTAAEGYRCFALIVHYGQPNGEEVFALRQSGLRNATVLHADVRLRGLGARGGLTQHGGEGVSPHYVPGRNGVFLALALSAAETVGAEVVVLGATLEDAAGFPDCRPAYLDAVRAMACAGMARAPGLVAPLAALTKAEVIRLGATLGVDFAATRSCYAATDAPCGMCGACVTRAKGFLDAGVHDPAQEVLL